MTVMVQPLILERLDEALQVWEATLGNGFKLVRQEVADRLQNSAGLFYIAIDDETDRIVGIKFGYFEGDVCIGRGIGVLPTYREYSSPKENFQAQVISALYLYQLNIHGA